MPEDFMSHAVSMECAGDIEVAVSITDMYGIDTYSSDVVGLIGVPIEINSVASFETVTITFRYDKERLGETKEEDLCILWYERLAAIGKNGTQICLHKKDDVLFCVPF